MTARLANSCRWCAGEQRPVASPAQRPQWLRMQCLRCGTISYDELPTTEQLAAIYSAAWSADTESGPNGSASEIAVSSMTKHLLNSHTRSAKVLDYGAGSGVFARALAQTRASEVHAFEPYGPPRQCGRVIWTSDHEGPWSAVRFDLIVMSEVIEHLIDPVDVLAGLADRLAPGGSIFVTTPNARGLWARQQKGKWREAQNPAHLCLFTAQSLDLCARRAGLAGFARSRHPVRYKAGLAAQFALTALQIAGLDGGLRGFLHRR